MPFGGRLTIELGSVVVDRHFAAKHPNVRLGLHALITVTAVRGNARADEMLSRAGITAESQQGSGPDKTMVDLGTLQALVADCGGHLWMTVEPVGDMIAKIRLPLQTAYGQGHVRTEARRAVRTLTRWFQH